MGQGAAAAGLGGVQAGLAFFGAQENNKTVKRAAAASAESQRIAGTSRRARLARIYSQFTSAARASAGERGIGAGGTAQAIEQAALLSGLQDTSQDLATQSFEIEQINRQANSQMRNPYLSAFEAGIQGAQAGASLHSSFSDFFGAPKVPTPAGPNNALSALEGTTSYGDIIQQSREMLRW